MNVHTTFRSIRMMASKASVQHLSLFTANNRFSRRSMNSCLFSMANLYSNWFFKTVLSPFRTISNIFRFSALSIPPLNMQRRVLKMNVMRLKICAFICQSSNSPNPLKSICRNIHNALLYLHSFYSLTSLILQLIGSIFPFGTRTWTARSQAWEGEDRLPIRITVSRGLKDWNRLYTALPI